MRPAVAALAGARDRLAAPRSAEGIDPNDVRSMFQWARAHRGPGPRENWRPHYAWGLLEAAKVGRDLGMDRISAIEFGVAGGNGLVALENIAEAVEALVGVGVDVFGFDTGEGLPKAEDTRDAAFALDPGNFPMDVEKLRSRLRRAELVLGLVGETVPEFLVGDHAPIGFVSFDLDYYSSTMDAFVLLDATGDQLMPRVFCYFDDIMWPPWTEFNGERAAISDFNSSHDQRKLSLLPGLRYSLPRSEFHRAWPEQMYVAELFDHELYEASEGLRRGDHRLK